MMMGFSPLTGIVVALLIATAAGQDPDGQTHGFISFAVPRLEVEESDAIVQIPLVREVGTSGFVLVTIEVINSTAAEDFTIPNAVVSFVDGQTSRNGILQLRNDALPEGNETHIVQITTPELGAEVGPQNTLQIVIFANDEPHGRFQFTESQTVVSEPAEDSAVIEIEVRRGPGIFGRVTVEYEVSNSPINDFTPSRGQLVFPNEVAIQVISLSILPDEIPEGNETYTLTLFNPTGGATLADSLTETQITILENDTPIRFSQAISEVSEDAGTVVITVTRGLLDNNVIGNLDLESTVSYATEDGLAMSGQDYISQNGVITFPPGVTSQTISIPILDDTNPEGDETFSILLSSQSSDAVLYLPSTATVVILVSDNAGGLVEFSSTDQVIVREDDGSVAEFVIQRTIGTVSDLIVAWQIISNVDGELAAADFQPPNGNVTIPDGQTEAVLQIQPFNDAEPEVAEIFTVELLSVVSGDGRLNEQGIRIASLVVAESDDIYGLVEWAEVSEFEVSADSPRTLNLAVVRTGGTTGILSVEYTVFYLPLGVADPSQGGITVAMASERLEGGQGMAEFSVSIPDEMFLEPMANFYAYLNGTSLVGGVTFEIPPSTSPSIGPRSEVFVPVPTAAANGYTGFDPASLVVEVEEPQVGHSTVSLVVSRSGAYGDATVTWVAVGATGSDIGDTGNVAVIAHGTTSATIDIPILPDEEPEIDESFSVTLLSISPSTSQRIIPQESTATVTILQNDNAAGVFSIDEATRGPFIIEESTSSIIQIIIQREGGALTNQIVQYGTYPDGISDFFGGFNFVNFAPEQREATITLLPQNDNIPETNETFFVNISSADGNNEILGSPTSVMIIILANDDYAGVFRFADSSLNVMIEEPQSSSPSAASTGVFTIQRDAGAFTSVTVSWVLQNGNNITDVSPSRNFVSFSEGQTSAIIQIQALPDEIPEGDETFTVVLTSVTGDARISSQFFEAVLTVRNNDNPIEFNGSVVLAEEDQDITFSVIRGGEANGVAEVTFEVIYITASSDEVVVLPASRTVVFQDGQRQTEISVSVVNDEEPEETEEIRIQLIETTGDAVIVPGAPSIATLLILPSDDPNGVFQFEVNSRVVTLEEGNIAQLEVERLQGAFGRVDLLWTAYIVNTATSERILASSSDISPPTNLLTFSEGNRTGVVEFTVVDDLQPELVEMFEVVLSIVSILGDSEDGALLGPFNTSVITVPENDDPYGLFRIADGSKMLVIAEDIPSGQPDFGRVTVEVERTFGTLGSVQVTWEIVPAVVPSLPQFTDLLFFGDVSQNVLPAEPRSGTGTIALQFTDQAGSVVTVPSQYHPTNINSGFTISLWLMPADGTSGVLVAKTTGGGLTRFYALELIADGENYIIRFSYLPEAQQDGFSTVEASVQQSALGGGGWHSLAVSVGQTTAYFYVDGDEITSRSLLSAIGDDVGELTVGGLSNGNFYAGSLQDVRIYSTMLTASQVAAIGTDVAASDVTPISGYLTYSDQETSREILITSIDDDTPESNKFFTVQLANSNGGARIELGENTADLTVLKSDAGNGIFGFDPQSLSSSITEPGNTSLIVNRERGTFETVTLYWEIRDMEGNIAGLDFNPASGELIFQSGDDQEILNIVTTDELIPELAENFTVVLAEVSSSDNQPSSVPSSGASINSSLSMSNITVRENDYPYGLLQFLSSCPPPGTLVPIAETVPEIFVEESNGAFTVCVARAQGNLGQVMAEYFTQDGSATSGGASPDYVPSAGSLQFIPGSSNERFMEISVTLIDDIQPELEKIFYVSLTNPSGDMGTPSLGIASSITLNILPSDDAFGVFQFAEDSLDQIVEEAASVTLTVVREGGSFGNISVYWVAEGMPEDLQTVEGVVQFLEEQTTGTIELTISEDALPEFHEVFNIRLTNVTSGASLSISRSVAVITVQSNDHPYGLFVFSSALRPVIVGEGVVLEVMVSREFGSAGTVYVDFSTIPSGNLTGNPALSGVDIELLLQNSNIATTNEDYLPTSGTLIFGDGETTKSIRVAILQDTLPELNEYIFIQLISATLNTSSVSVVDPTVFPAIPAGNDSLAFVVIEENDNARGVIEFPSSTINATEGDQSFIQLLRSRGTFGEVTVLWEAMPTSAQSADFSPSSGTVTFSPGDTVLTIPLSIVDDDEPEFSESLSVNISLLSGGASLGAITSATISIARSDDPNGALEFAPESRMVEVSEPENGSPFDISLTVQRGGGEVGVIEVAWELTTAGGTLGSDDIGPSTGTVHFLSSIKERDIVLSIQPDDIPEITETFTVRLVSTEGGATIATNSEAVIRILPSDRPYGVVSFEDNTFIAVEGDNDTFAMVPVARSAGTFGDLRLSYNILSLDVAALAQADGTPALNYYQTPVPMTALSSSVLLSEPAVTGGATECAEHCLRDEACRSFSSDDDEFCQLYHAAPTAETLVTQTEASLYEKNQELTEPLYQSVATPGSDFLTGFTESIVIPQGLSRSAIPVTIIGDTTPELDESLSIVLTAVELTDISVEDSADPPELGAINETTVVIAQSDDPFGRFEITASNGESEIRVLESDNFGVSLSVDRQGGTIGDVQVTWVVVPGNSTATEGEDYAGTGAVLSFQEGVTRSTIALSIIGDAIPERDEYVVIQLVDATGGATVAPGDGGITRVIIEANDNAAGIVGLSPLSRSAVVSEGEEVSLVVQREIGNLGRVAVSWQITGPGNVTLEFASVLGVVIIEDGASSADLVIEVRADSTPEIAEPYDLTLTSVQTLSSDISSPSAVAVLDPQATTATITIRASDNPHGVVEFQSNSLSVNSDESIPTELTLIRQFGTFGAIDVTYMAEMGNLSRLDDGAVLATAGVDFVSDVLTVRLQDGQQSTVIPAPIIDDTIPEIYEVFTIRLLNVNLVVPENGTISPSIGPQNRAQVIITPNDSPQGEFTFLQSMVTVEETSGTVAIRVQRVQGLLGEVSVVYVISNEGATNGEDFSAVSPEELVFAPGQSEQTINVTIIDDLTPEVDESLCIQLSLPEGGATLGSITQTCVIIAASDNAFGVFSFDQNSLSATLTEAGEATMGENVAQLRVIRSGGLFDEITLPFEVELAGREDLSPATGALVFANNEDFRILQIEAVADAIPELTEMYTISLLPPVGSGNLADRNTTATITILPNQNPNGLFGVFSVDNDSVSVEEDMGYAVLEIRRSDGTIGEVSVTVATVEDSAIAPLGNVPAFSIVQLIETVSAEKWYQFNVAGQDYLTLVTSSPSEESTLFAWEGALSLIQTFSTYGATAVTNLMTNQGQTIVVVANGGSPGNREINSTAYTFTGEQLLETQSIPTVGASDVVSFQTSGQYYIMFANRENSAGSPNVNSPVLMWTGAQFEETQVLQTIGASALEVFTIGSSLYLAVGSATDSRSQLFIWTAGEFQLHQVFESQQVSDIDFLDLGGVQYLTVVSEESGLSILRWNSSVQQFTLSDIIINAPSPIRVESIPERGYLLITNNDDNGQIFAFDENFQPVEWDNTTLPSAQHLYPFIPTGSDELFVTAAINSQPNITEASQVLQLVGTSDTVDFHPRNFTLTFADGERSHMITLEIIDDNIPETDETFSIQLSNPSGGARLGPQSVFPVIILTNDAAHGLIGFAPSSQSVITQELEFGSSISLEVVRNGGAFGQVEVSWMVTGDHNEGEVLPDSGTAVFLDGVSRTTINLVIQPDSTPEFSELTQVTLTEVTVSGVPPGGDDTRGAQLIPGQTVATVTVEANDAPHGVVTWSPSVVIVNEEEGVDSTVQLTLIREFGSIGAITISYSTAMATGLPADESATQGLDYITSTGSVVIGDNETVASVPVTILHDNVAELTETFLVTITDVQLVDETDRQGSSSNSPRAELGGESVQVMILENDNAGGILSFAATALSVLEESGSIAIPVARSGGAFGSVTVEFTTTGVTASGNGIDFSPAAGSAIIEEGEQIGFIVVNITNDSEPELEETFIVTLVSVFQGAQLSPPTTAVITIARNDDINGVFSFSENSLLFLIPESEGPDDPAGVVMLTVERTRNFVGTVTVYWEVSEDGVMDLEPNTGNLTFVEDEMQQTFQVRAVTDGIPEPFESFTVVLASADGGGRIADPSESRIAIQASDDIGGLIRFDQYPVEGIIINEGDQIDIRVLRESGLQGIVSVTWEIAPGDTNVFVTTTDSVVFESGQTTANITLQTISDSTPEVARLFSLRIISASQARVDLNSSELGVIVAASDSPHGVVEFTGPLVVETAEVDTTLSIAIQRSFGLVGSLRVNFSVMPVSAAMPDDFIVPSQYIIIPGDAASGEIAVEIVDDSTPELLQSFTIVLDSVELAEDINGGRDFDFSQDPSLVDQPPSLGSNREFEVRIAANDDPNGVISFTNSIYHVTEGDTAVISLVRTAGSFEPVVVNLFIEDGSAVENSDYLPPTVNEVLFGPDQTSADIFITILDDLIPELSEDFSVSISLGDPSTGARLGSITIATIVIGANDSPFGEVGFADTTGIVLDNPTAEEGAVPVIFSVVRNLGTVGATDIFWMVEGPDPGMERFDIDSSTLQGTLRLADGQSNGIIEVMVLPSEGPEMEEQFTVTIVSASNNVIVDPARMTTTITVSQRGMPFGVVGFFGDAIGPQAVAELEDTVQILSLPLFRSEGTFGSTDVLFVVAGDGPLIDVAPANGTIAFEAGQSQTNLELQILPDSEPEFEETFTVTLIESTNGAAINPLASTATFIISANDDPYGLFGLTNPNILSSSSGGIVSRTVNAIVTRERGNNGSVRIEVTAMYDPEPTAEYVPQISNVLFEDGDTEKQLSLEVAQGVLLAPETYFTLTITSTLVISRPDVSGILSGISPTAGSLQLRVTEEHANPIVGFSETSLEAEVIDDAIDYNVQLAVTRRGGPLGEVTVYWTAGLPNGLVANGSIAPSEGTFRMGLNNYSAEIGLRATPRQSPTPPEVFAVSLLVESATPGFPAQLDSTASIALIEPQGVVQLAAGVYTGVEGQEVKITVWRRYGSRGDIMVTGVSTVTSSDSIPANQEAATESDFSTQVSGVISDGVATGEITIQLPDNSQSAPLKVFQFTLTSVQRLPAPSDSVSSPRLASTDLSTLITIVDDEGGAGVFQFGAASISINEVDGSPSTMDVYVTRSGGFAGRVTVVVTSMDGRIGFPSDDTVASEASGDYDEVNQELIFENGESIRQLRVRVRDDTDPEMIEYFTLVLSNPESGYALISPNASTLEVGIIDNDIRTSIFQIRKDDRLAVTTEDAVTLIVEKVDGSDLTSIVTVTTVEFDTPVVIGELPPFGTAAAGRDYSDGEQQLVFTAGITQLPVTISTNSTTTSVAFGVRISVTTSPINPSSVQNGEATVLISPEGALGTLHDIYFDAFSATSTSELEMASLRLKDELEGGRISGSVTSQWMTTKLIIDEIVNSASASTTTSTARRSITKALSSEIINNVLDVFEAIISDNSFSRRTQFVQSMQNYAYSLLNGLDCQGENGTSTEAIFTYSRASFYLEAIRAIPSALTERRFSFGQQSNDDFLQLPDRTISTAQDCVDVHYIEFFSAQLFMEPTLQSKAFSIGTKDTLPTIPRPITYRIYTGYDTLPAKDDCLWWMYSLNSTEFGSWITEDQDQPICTAKTPIALQQDFIECECNRLGEFSASSTVTRGYGWTIPAPLSCIVVMVVMLMVVILHTACFQRTLLTTRIFMMLCVSIFLFQMMGLVTAFASSSASSGGCSALGILLQFTVVAQFIWMLALAVSLWVNFMGFTDGKEPLIIYAIVSWGGAALIVVATILIGRFAAALEFSELYGLTGDICFMPDLSAALLSTLLPVVLAVLAVIALVSHSCVYWSRWEDYHNMYYESFNKTEIPALLAYFSIIFLTWLLGSLHMYLQEVYTFSFFVAFNVIQGIYALVVYFFVSLHTMTRKHKRFGLGDEVEPLTVAGEPDYLGSMSSLASSRQKLVPEDEWDEDNHPPASVIPLRVKRVPSDPSFVSSDMADSGGEDSQNIDDLMFMLKTHTYPSGPEEDADSRVESPGASPAKKPSGSEHLQLRRISIADTHL